MFAIHKAARILRAGGTIAYPTEGVFGLGCLPDRADAVIEILAVKKRGIAKGLLLIGANAEQVEPWVDLPRGKALPPPTADKPITWVVPAAADVPEWLTGGRETIAVRITTFAIAAALCDAVGSALVSTSANISGRRPARNTYVLRRQFCDLVDYIVPGRCGTASGPSEIRDLLSGKVMRASAK